jgi:outer membrane protein W
MKSVKIMTATGLVSALMLIGSAAGMAQFVKGDWLADMSIGNISFNKADYQTTNATASSKQADRSFSTVLNPTVGYFIGNHLVVGGSLAVGYQHFRSKAYAGTGKLSTDYQSASTSLGAGPFIRYYFAGNKQLRWYGQVKAAYNTILSNKNETNYYNAAGDLYQKQLTNYPDNLHGLSAHGLLGFNYFLSTAIALNSSIGYYYSKLNVSQTYTSILIASNTSTTSPATSTAQKSGSFAWNIGFSMILHRAKK